MSGNEGETPTPGARSITVTLTAYEVHTVIGNHLVATGQLPSLFWNTTVTVAMTITGTGGDTSFQVTFTKETP